MKYSGFRKLVVWQEALNLTILIYKLTESFPKNEQYVLTSQMRRAAISVMSQIAEGWLRKSTKEKIRYLEIAEGSILEIENDGEVAKALKYWNKSQYEQFNDQRSRTAYLLYKYKTKIED